MTYPLSQSQLSIYLACQGLDPDGGNYQQASLYKLPETVDLERLSAAFEAVVRAHPYALSRIVLEEGMPRIEDHSADEWHPLVREVDSIDSVQPTIRMAVAAAMVSHRQRNIRSYFSAPKL